jgi:hypothetical protein
MMGWRVYIVIVMDNITLNQHLCIHSNFSKIQTKVRYALR